jgi:hypothetical protein
MLTKKRAGGIGIAAVEKASAERPRWRPGRSLSRGVNWAGRWAADNVDRRIDGPC